MRGKEIVHFLHISKNAGSQLRHMFPLVNAEMPGNIYLRREAHAVTLAHLPAEARYFFSLRDPVSRFKSGFYCRKRKSRPRYDIEWSPHEARAFARFEHANDLAEALFREDERGREATAAMRSISHLARNQVDWFKEYGFLFELRPPVWILRTDNFRADWQILLDRLGIPSDVPFAKDAVSGHRNDYAGAPPLSERAMENIRRWYVQDQAFYNLCLDWLDRESARQQGEPAAKRVGE